MSYGHYSDISHRTPDSAMWGDLFSLHVQTFVNLCHRCWSSNVSAYLTESCEILRNRRHGGNSR